MSALPNLALKKDALRRLRDGHLWIYSNELAVAPGANSLAAGAAVNLLAPNGQLIGSGLFNPATLIAVRLFARSADCAFDAEFFADRMRAALRLRQQLGRSAFGRQIHGEGDGLPGLILDRYGDTLVGQIGSAGLEQRHDALVTAIRAVYVPSTLIWKNDASGRALEGLPEVVAHAFGDNQLLQVQEGPAQFAVPLDAAQKTGWFYDQRDNRDRVFALLESALSAGEVLDLCSYHGGWSLRALHAGARAALCVDASAQALAACSANALANGFGERLHTVRGDAQEHARALAASERRFRLVIADPPAFIKRRKDLDAGCIAYARWFDAAMRCVEPGGFLVACSCSHHYPADRLLQALAAAAIKQRRELRVLAELGQSADHPVHPAMPETRYLKGVLCQLG